MWCADKPNSISVPMTASTVSAARVFAACAAWARRLRSSRTPKNTEQHGR